MHVKTPMSSAVWHRAVFRFGVPLAAAVTMIALAATSASAFVLERASVASDGTESDMSITTSALSADGRYVAFVTSATNLVPDDTNFALDVFVRDRVTGTTERASVGNEGQEANGQSATPVLSADGRYVVFASQASNLVAGDANGRFDVFLRDRLAGTTERVSVATDGSQGNFDSIAPAVSADGRYVAFSSAASNLVAGDTNNAFDVFVRDRLAQTTTRVSVASDGSEGNSLSLAPRISGDGAVVVFHSFSSNLVAGDTNGAPDVFVHEVSSGATSRASVASDGTQGNQQSIGAMVSADGRFVAFDSDASTLVAGDVNGRTDVFVHDRTTGATERVSVASDGTEANNRSGFVDPPALSADGRWVAFTSSANNLVGDDTNNVVDVFLHDRQTGATIRVNVTPDGVEADGGATLWPSVSADGRVVAFASMATNLVPDDLNFVQDVFLWVDTCGNGALEAGEACDDGNVADGDCCSSACEVVPAGAACDDGDLCTRADSCDEGGTCVGSDPVVCEGGGEGQCGSAAQCDPATGACVGGPLPDGSTCDDGDSCTVGDVCLDGACEPGALEPAACVSSFQCYAAASWRRPPWWFSSSKVVVTDLFESTRFQLGGTEAVCTALAPPDGQLAEQLACVRARPAGWPSGPSKRAVRVANELGEHVLKVGRADRVCLPAGELAPPAEPGLDAFKCHPADDSRHGPRFRKTTVEVSDAFGTATVDVLRPAMLCNPASVDGSEVLHGRAHLVCYDVRERWRWGRSGFRPRNLRIAHAAADDLVTLLWRDHLCVPSTVVDDD